MRWVIFLGGQEQLLGNRQRLHEVAGQSKNTMKLFHTVIPVQFLETIYMCIYIYIYIYIYIRKKKI